MKLCFLVRNEHKDMLSSFGLAEDSNFPTAAFVPAKSDSDSKVTDTKISINICALSGDVLCLCFVLKINNNCSRNYIRHIKTIQGFFAFPTHTYTCRTSS